MGLGLGVLVVLVFVGAVEANVVVVGRNVSVAFKDLEANFAATLKSSGVRGILYQTNPLDACTSLANRVTDGPTSQFALIIRGNCSFVEKVKNAQKAGFKAAIVYDNEDDGALISMGGSSSSIKIYAVFVSKASGEALRKYASLSDMNVWIIPTFENSAWSIMAIAFISLLAMSAVLATCFFVRRHSVRREGPRASNVTEFHGMSSRSVKAMPSLIFTTVQEDNCTSMTCAICLEDYAVGEKIRILPCRHKFHAFCVDMWLTSWRTFCPVCKRDARMHIDIPPASEYTPLLSSRAASATAIGLSSFHSSLTGSPAIQILPSPSRASLTSRNHSLSSTPHILNQLRSYNNSPATSIGRSSIDPRNMSSYRSHAPYLLSSHSLGVAFASPVASRLAASPQVNSSGYGSPSYLVGSSSRQSYLRNSESMTSFLSSAQSLPDC